MKQNVFLALLIILPAFFTGASFASNKKSYKDYQSIPPVFHKYLLNIHTVNDLTNYVLEDLSMNNNIYNAVINMEYVMDMKKQSINIERHHQYYRLRFIDTNRDREISQYEIDKFMEGQEKWSEKKKKKALEEIKSYDKDSNGTLSDKEMMLLSDKGLEKLEEQFEMVKVLYEENNRKNFIKREEITAVINKVFFTLDINQDGTISLEESFKFKESLGGKKVKDTRSVPFKKTCSFSHQKIPIPENVSVYAIGAKKGKPIDVSFGANRNSYVFDLYVNSPKKPVVLILWAYEATLWKINLSEGTQLAGVIAGGYYTQIITGVSQNLPVFLTHYAGHIRTVGPCRPHRFDSNDANAHNAVKTYAEWVLERPVTNFHLVKNDEKGEIHLGETVNNKTVFTVMNEDANSAGMIYSSSQFYKAETLTQGINNGMIRKATEMEINSWNKQRSAIDTEIYEETLKKLGQSKADEELRKQLVRENYGPPLLIIPREAYVVLNSGYTVPLGIEEYFILPHGTKPATGGYGRSQLMDMNTMECYTGPYKPCSKIRLPLDRTSNLPAIIED